MPVAWEDFVKQPEYKDLSIGEKENAKKQYFDQIFAPKIDKADYDNALSQFYEFADKAERDNMTTFEKVVDTAENAGLAALSGAGKSVTGKYIKRAVNAAGLETPFLDSTDYAPRSIPTKVIEGVSSIGADAGIFKVGGALAKMKDVPMFAQKLSAGAGAFGLHSGLSEVQRKKEAGELETLELKDFASPMLETLKGAATGTAVSLAGAAAEKIGKTAAETAFKHGISQKMAARLDKAVTATTALPLEGGALLSADYYLNNTPLTAERAGQLAMELIVLKSIHANPFSKEVLRGEAERRGINETEILKEIKEDPAVLKDPAAAKVIIEEAGKQAELKKPEQVDLRFKIQEQIATDMVMRNWKPGKTPEDVLQMNQIPKEYADYALIKTDAGTYTTDPRMLERVNEGIKLKELFDDSKLPFVDNSPELIDKYKGLRDEYQATRDNMKHFENSRDSIWENHWKDALDEQIGDHRRFTDQPEIRSKMDESVDQILSTIDNNQAIDILNDPTILNDYYDKVEMGVSGLKDRYKKAVNDEVVAHLKRMNPPRELIDTASRLADHRTLKMQKGYENELLRIEREGKRIRKDPYFQIAIDEINAEKIPVEQKTEKLKAVLDKVRDECSSAEMQVLTDETLSDVKIDDQTMADVREIAVQSMQNANIDNIQDAPGVGKTIFNGVSKFLIFSRGNGIARESARGAEMVNKIQECYRETELREGELHREFEKIIKDLSPEEKDLIQTLRQRGMETFAQRANGITEEQLDRILKSSREISGVFDNLLLHAQNTGLTEFSTKAAKLEIKKKDRFYILEDDYGRIVGRAPDRETLTALKNKLMVHKISEIHDYLPRLVNPEIFVDPRAHKALVDYLIESGQVSDDAVSRFIDPSQKAQAMRRMANNLLNVFNKTASERRAFFQYERIIDLPEKLTYKNKKGKVVTIKAYEQDLDTILSKYAESYAERVTQAEYFGNKDQILKGYLPEIAAELGTKYHMEKAKIEYNRAEALVDMMISHESRALEVNKLTGLVLGYNVITKMGLSPIGQLPQMFMSIPRTNLSSAIKAAKWRWQNPEEARDFAIRCGSGLSSIRRSMMKNALMAGSRPEKFLEAIKFTKMDSKSRVIAATSGLFYAEHLTDLLTSKFDKRRDFAKRRLLQLEINPEEVISRGRNERGKYELTEREKLIAARRAEVDTNFRARAIDLAPVFTDSAWCKVLTQFKSFGYEMTKFLNMHIVQEARHGNAQPLLQLLVIGGISGAVVNEVRGLITGRPSNIAAIANDEEDAIFNFMIDSFATAGMFGVFNDVISTIDYGQLPLGPTISTALSGAEGLYKTIDKENPAYLGMAAAREIPFVGSAAKRAIQKINKGDDPTTIWTGRYDDNAGKHPQTPADIRRSLHKNDAMKEINKIKRDIRKSIGR